MKIEVWSDYVCPFCYIGKRRLEEAIKASGLEEVEVVYKAYELEPNAIATSDESMIEVLAGKYKISIEEAKAMTDNVALQAQSVGLNYDFEKMRPANTFHAHRLAKFAEQEGLGEQMTEQLLHAYFIEGEKIGTFETLVELSKKLGLSEERTKEMLHSEEFADDVKEDIKEAGQIGVQGVPFFVINRKYAISGAQPTETFVNALRKAAGETV
ncbi:DsbA family protein [Sporosarcina pasteurii]|uniref:Protein-disulfide isomerase n=2 Tax=Sporosarcina pasteurii TaxID=1474 RepID=A0A380CIY2_SPOPA|nr:DsbA family oxidoreductase [Sporosarcina pasteurii]MDS9472134.1 DsbA family oxidoreductase [Sporosarcina pasteurii]QBQ06849.1 DsbA family oxidoreductase [Sporosarcina pasteurii]SUJ20417.1 Protein-disulfide isomerase [Sporosarcina pasteurii]